MQKVLTGICFASFLILSNGTAKAEDPTASNEKSSQLCGASYQHVVNVFREISINKDVKFNSKTADYINFENTRTKQIWTFTTEQHEAHPTAICREVVQINEQVFVKMDVLCEAAKDKCDVLVEAFDKHNESISQNLQ